MKNAHKLIALMIAILPVFSHASGGAEALQRFHERNKAKFEQQMKDHQKRDQEKLQASKESQTQTTQAGELNDEKAAR